MPHRTTLSPTAHIHRQPDPIRSALGTDPKPDSPSPPPRPPPSAKRASHLARRLPLVPSNPGARPQRSRHGEPAKRSSDHPLHAEPPWLPSRSEGKPRPQRGLLCPAATLLILSCHAGFLVLPGLAEHTSSSGSGPRTPPHNHRGPEVSLKAPLSTGPSETRSITPPFTPLAQSGLGRGVLPSSPGTLVSACPPPLACRLDESRNLVLFTAVSQYPGQVWHWGYSNLC